MNTLPNVVIVGRPNVGKSSLLNRIVGSRHAIVDPTPGVTRDRNYAPAIWNGRPFQVIDTGGLDPDNKTSVQDAIDEQVAFALKEADAIVLLCDSREGLLSDDQHILKLLRRKCGEKPLFVCVNKIDSPSKADLILAEFYRLGINKLFPISALHGHGVADLLDEVVENFPRNELIDEHILKDERIAFVGKPNVGKSMLFNQILGYERQIVDDKPGTTRDAITVSIERNGKIYRLIDTAGLRRPSAKKDPIETHSISRTLNAIQKSDIAVLLLDASEGKITEQDKRIAARILDAGSACVIVWNKWDIVDEKMSKWKELEKHTRDELFLMDFAPVIAISAKTGQRLDRLFELIDSVRVSGKGEISEKRLAEILMEALIIQPPPSYKGRALSVRNLRQLTQSGIIFKVLCNEPEGLHFSYRRYLLNQIRAENPFTGWPVRLLVGKPEAQKVVHGKPAVRPEPAPNDDDDGDFS
jgi:GTP-binding protein